ncbi:MAG TPA: 2-deoxyribose-5-phosphate aldolase, partial [Clostridia bacterium]|nr:2-deoxyribose-5-phosphate aldolase [Clostridia bacterium]
MNIKSILSKVDHTLLKQTATWDDIKQVCEDAVKYKCASACIPPYFVKTAKNYFKDKLNVCTVIGFPNGYSTTKTKCYETSQAISDGAHEIDMVLNINML